MVVNHAKAQERKQEIAKFEIALRMANIVIGCHGKNALSVVAKVLERE